MRPPLLSPRRPEGGDIIVISLMHAQSDFWGDARSLLDWGFAERTKVQLVATLVDPIPLPSEGRSRSDSRTRLACRTVISPRVPRTSTGGRFGLRPVASVLLSLAGALAVVLRRCRDGIAWLAALWRLLVTPCTFRTPGDPGAGYHTGAATLRAQLHDLKVAGEPLSRAATPAGVVEHGPGRGDSRYPLTTEAAARVAGDGRSSRTRQGAAPRPARGLCSCPPVTDQNAARRAAQPRLGRRNGRSRPRDSGVDGGRSVGSQ